MIETIVFDVVLSTTELTELWRTGAIYGLLFCITAFGAGFIINSAFGFMNNI